VSVGLVVLAAGASTRLGHPKQLVTYQGRSLLARAVETALASNLGPVRVVLGAHADVIRPVLAPYAVREVYNPAWEAGLGGSIAAAIADLTDEAAALLLLCDQPGLAAAHLQALAATGKPVAASAYGGSLGVPACFTRETFAELLALAPQVGAKPVIMRDPARVAAVTFAAGGFDVDTPADLAALAES
jgi:molybdenum cofactor cytidylyltransferase